MGWMSPKDLNEDPRKWLNIPHEFHEPLLELQEKLFPGFKKKLEDLRVHCFKCEGVECFPVVLRDTFEGRLCTGICSDPDNPDDFLLHLVDPNKKEGGE